MEQEKENQSHEHLVFVYGSLKSGFSNNKYHLGTSKFIGEGITLFPVYDMVSLGGFPGVKKGGECFIQGELYSVNDKTFEGLDFLEGNGQLYLREKTEVVTQDGELHAAWMYIFLRPLHSANSSYERVEHLQTELGAFVQSWQEAPAVYGKF